MAKVFFPDISVSVPASSPHPANTEYRVSIGQERWDRFEPVVKIQMVYDGTVSGRRSPSFPLDSDDAERVMQAIREVMQRWRSDRSQ